MNPFLPCHLIMLQSLYNVQTGSNDDDESIDLETPTMLWDRISMYMQQREALQNTMERLKDIKDALMEAKGLNHTIGEEFSPFPTKEEKKQQPQEYYSYGHYRSCSNSINEGEAAAAKVAAWSLIHTTLSRQYHTLKQNFVQAIEPFVELEVVVQKELTSLRTEESRTTSEEQDFGFISNKIYLWERLLHDVRKTINLEEDGDTRPRQKLVFTDEIIV